MSRVNLTRQVKTDDGWKRVVLERDSRGRVRWGSGEGRYLVEWREGVRRLRAAGATPAEALEAQGRKRLELEARENNLELLGLPKEEDNILVDCALQNFLRDIKAFRKPLTPQKYEYVVGLFNFFSTLKIDNPVKEVPRHRCPLGSSPGYDSSEVLKYECFSEASRGSENHYSQ